MERVIEIYHDGVLLRLVDEAEVGVRDNTYTVVVGRTALGKAACCRTLLGYGSATTT